MISSYLRVLGQPLDSKLDKLASARTENWRKEDCKLMYENGQVRFNVMSRLEKHAG
jgi:hypothetical protein